MATPSSGFSVLSPSVALGAAKTVLYLTSDGKTAFDIVEMGVSCVGTAGFLLIELVAGTNAGAGTGTVQTPLAMRTIPGPAEARTEAKVNYSAEPTVLTALKAWRSPLPMAPFVLQWPLGREPGCVSLTAATSGSRIGIRLTVSTGTPEGFAYFEFEE